MRLLLDFKADPNTVVSGRSLLAIACRKGYPEAIKLLLDSKARFDAGSYNPILECIRSGSRESLAILIKDHVFDLIHARVGDERNTILIEAIAQKTTLLPVLATIIQKETKEANDRGEANVPPFPPLNLRKSMKRRLDTALELKDNLIPVDVVLKKVKHLKSPWSAQGLKGLDYYEQFYINDGSTIADEATLDVDLSLPPQSPAVEVQQADGIDDSAISGPSQHDFMNPSEADKEEEETA